MVKRTLPPQKAAFFTNIFPFYCRRHRLDDKPDGIYPLHRHNYFELELVMSGKGKHYFNTATFPLSVGTCFMLQPFDLHSIYSDPSEPLDVYTLQFSHMLLQQELQQKLHECDYSLLLEASFDDSEHAVNVMLCDQMEREAKQFNMLSQPIIKSLLNCLCYRLIRNSLKTMQKREIPAVVQQMLSYIALRFTNSDLSVKNIANHIDRSPNYIGALFQSQMGVSINQYICQLRLENARNLLMQTDASISQIAYESGFNTVSYFSRKFEEYYGITPSALRGSKRQKSSGEVGEANTVYTSDISFE